MGSYDDDSFTIRDAPSFTFTIEHDLKGKGSSFSPRNDVKYKAGSAFGGKSAPSFQLSKYTFTDDEVQAIVDLANNGGFYRIRAPVLRDVVPENDGSQRVVVSDDTEQKYVMASIKACRLVASHFTEHLTFHVDETGHIVSLTLTSPNSECPERHSSPSSVKTKHITSVVRVDVGSEGVKVNMALVPHKPAPRVQSGVDANGNPIPNDGKAGNAVPQKQSWWRQYWYIWVPVVLMFSMNTPPEDAQRGGAQKK
jgi:hypothetical protein